MNSHVTLSLTINATSCTASDFNSFSVKQGRNMVYPGPIDPYLTEKLLKSEAVQLVALIVKDNVTCEFT